MSTKPWGGNDAVSAVRKAEEPPPGKGVEEHAKGGRSFGRFVGPGLWMLDAEMLLRGAEGIFVGPTPGSTDDILGLQVHIGTYPVVIVLDCVGIAADDQQDRRAGDRVPEHDAGVDQPALGASALIGDDRLPAFCRGADLLRCSETGAFPAWPSRFPDGLGASS